MIKQSELDGLSSKQAVDQFIEARFAGETDLLVTALDAELNELLRSDLHKAQRFCRTVGMCFNFLPARYGPRWLAMRGRLSHWVGDYSDSLSAYSEALKGYKKQRDGQNAARLRRGLMDVLMYLGRYDEAVRMGKSALTYFRRHDLESDEAKVLTNIGNVYHRTDRNRLALTYYDKARKLLESEGGVSLAVVAYNQANIYTNLNDLERAEGLYNFAARIYKQHRMDIARCQAEYSLAYIYFLRDQYAEALTLLERVNESFECLGDRKSSATVALDLVELNNKLNLCSSAVSEGGKAIPALKKLGMRYEEAKANYFVAETRAKSGDFKNATLQFRRAERLFEDEGNRLWLGMVNLGRARALLCRNRSKMALEACRKAQKLYRQCGDKRRINDARLTEVEALIQNRDLSQSRALLSRIEKESLVGYQRLTMYYLLGLLSEKRDDLSSAVEEYQKGAAVLEEMTSGLYSDEIRFFFVADKLDVYVRAADCLIRLGLPGKSFVRQVRALALLNQKGQKVVRQDNKLPVALIERRERLRAALKKLQQIPNSLERNRIDLSTHRNLENELWSIERRVRSFEPLQSRRSTPTHRLGIHSQRAILDTLGSQEALVSFRFDHGELGAYCATRGEVEYLTLSYSPVELRHILRKLHFVCEQSVSKHESGRDSGRAAEKYLKQINEALITPIEDRLTNKRLILIVDDIFAGIPFYGLMDERGVHLGKRLELRIIADPADLFRRQHDTGKPVFKSNIVFAVSLEGLQAVESEAMAISRFFPGTVVYRDQQATCKRLFRELRMRTGFVHIAAHAARSSENPLFSRVLMGDGPFFPFDLFGVGVRARLVTLSGCQTAAPGVYYGSSFSLAKSFYQAGAKTVLASLWPVSDRLSQVFMKEFYGALENTENVWRAYDVAFSRLTDLTGNPAYWSSFVLLGM